MQIWAHRGASAYAPENTLPAFEKALEQGADGVELDVQRSADGQLVVIHDETISRTSNGIGKVADLSLEEMLQCNFANGFVGYRKVSIPTLREVLELVGPSGATINVELKNNHEPYPGMGQQVVELVRQLGLLDQVIISSFNHASLAELRGTVPPANLGLLLTDAVFNPWDYANWFGAGALHPNFKLLRQVDYVWLAHEAGIKVHAWTLDEEGDLLAAQDLGVDAAITNFPDVGKSAGHSSLAWWL